MSNIKLITRKNSETNQTEEYVLTTGKVITFESTSKLTKKNSKKYGYFSAEIDGRQSAGIAYDAVVAGREIKAGDTIQVEILKSDAVAGHNNRWKLALSTTEDLGKGISDFLAGL
ncbi:MAG: hypothetical protein ABGY11_13780 [Candidatus Thioglobus sp.]